MKKRIIVPMALAATMLFGFGCASSNDTMNNDTSAMDSDMSMSETQTMAGNEPDAVVVEESVVAVQPIATISSTTLSMENTTPLDDMFENVDDTEQYDVMELAKMEPNLSTFVTLVEQSGLQSDLDRLDEYTVLAPTNEAFAKLPKDKLETLLMSENRAVLKSILQAHILPNEIASTQFENNSRIQVGEDSYIPVSVGVNNTNITVGGAQLVKTNIEASNGVIHVIDNVILPRNAQNDALLGF
ncbi:fasciclin domain-containing protein [Pontibacter litorisediminis]|uniref:fasciclin domain-containing protein n=1 Tax=Pontibacter litorisediminis TaxID=1846260 RepID=UPI0023EDDD01|nr:fasciclin domain-containing protein [Pontibacter litorisediminis]